MITEELTPEMIEEMKKIYEENKDKLKPNRKSGEEIVEYLLNKYHMEEIIDEDMNEWIVGSVLENEYLKKKLPEGVSPNPVGYYLENCCHAKELYENQDGVFKGLDIIIGVDLSSGFYMVEGSSELFDEILAFRGLDEDDLKNYVCVAEYVKAKEKFDK